jgi:hypothetical protein
MERIAVDNRFMAPKVPGVVRYAWEVSRHGLEHCSEKSDLLGQRLPARSAVAGVLSILHQLRVNLLGLILNQVKTGSSRYYARRKDDSQDQSHSTISS